jgi:hypothetical protein
MVFQAARFWGSSHRYWRITHILSDAAVMQGFMNYKKIRRC